MSFLTCAATGQSISLTQQIAKSGEGEIWQTNLQGTLAKIYNSADSRRIRKLEVMIAYPPKDPNAEINHISFAWPQSLLRDTNGNAVGFLMPEIANSVQLLDVYNPQRRQKVLPGFSWLYLHTTAMNIASIVWAIHRAGYVLGDIKSENILVNNRALPAIIDTDSFQVRHPNTGEIYPCLVGSEGFTPVELMGKDLATVEQTVLHDRFRLGIIVYLLLFGDYPFKGLWVGPGDSPPPSELVRNGYWSYAANSLIQPGPLTIPLNVVHPAVRQCFLRCFNEGHANPERRPTPADWVNALKLARAELQVCKKVKSHTYSQSYGKCYWCDRKTTLGVDIFPPMTRSRKPANQVSKKIKAFVDKFGKQQKTQPAAKTPTQPGKSVSQTATMPGKTLKSKIAAPASAARVNSTQSSNSVNRSTSLITVGTGIVAISGVFALLIFLSQSKIDANEIALTTVGVLLSLGLVAIGFLWLKVMDRYNL
jgi:DNA-binding helix-hairpin-helix protein with protein kinase domain